jgi:small subunit ribosomal protein S2
MAQQEQPIEVHDIKKKIASTGIEIGTPVKTKFMSDFITEAGRGGAYKMNLDITLQRIKTAAKFINRIGPSNVIVCSGRSGKTRVEKLPTSVPIEKFCEMTGVKKLLGRFMPGTLTNPSLSNYIEPKLVLVSDPQVDDQAITEATNAGIPIIGISNTDNVTARVDVVIPANNRGRKSLATAYWLLTREILIDNGTLKEGDQMKYDITDFETKESDEAIE